MKFSLFQPFFWQAKRLVDFWAKCYRWQGSLGYWNKNVSISEDTGNTGKYGDIRLPIQIFHILHVCATMTWFIAIYYIEFDGKNGFRFAIISLRPSCAVISTRVAFVKWWALPTAALQPWYAWPGFQLGHQCNLWLGRWQLMWTFFGDRNIFWHKEPFCLWLF